MSFIVSEGFGPEGMTDDSIGVAFENDSEISINMNLVIDEAVAEVDIADDNIEMSLDIINMDIDIGD